MQAGGAGLRGGAGDQFDGVQQDACRARARTRVRVDGERRLGERPAEQVGDADGDAVGADVEGGQLRAVGDEPVEPGVGAAALGARLADDRDQARFPEPFDEVGDGGPGESGAVPELAGGQGAFVAEEFECDAVVDGAGRARGRGAHAGVLADAV